MLDKEVIPCTTIYGQVENISGKCVCIQGHVVQIDGQIITLPDNIIQTSGINININIQINEDDLKKITSIVENIVERKAEELKEMERHIHNNVENINRKLEIEENRICELTYMLADRFNIPEKEYDKIIKFDSDFYSSLYEIYSPIDRVDRKRWEDHLNEEKMQWI